jgi:cytochrome c556
MKTHAREVFVGLAALALGLWLLAGGGSAADEKDDTKGSVQKIADALERGDTAEAKKIADDLAKNVEELRDVMNLMRPPKGKRPGFKVGEGKDGIETTVQSLAKKADPNRVQKDADELVKMAYRIQAIAEVAKAKPTEKVEGQKMKMAWEGLVKDMGQGAQDLADAAKNKDAPALKKAAAKLDNTCNSCHETFRD